MSNITTRFAKEEDLPEILHLFAKGMRGYESYPYRLFWQWKHILNPFGTSPVLLALDNEQIVGIRAFMRWEVLFKGKQFNAFRAVDTVTDPEYQGKGIFKRLTLELIEHLDKYEEDSFIFNTPNKASRPGYLKMGWQVLGKAPVFVRVLPLAMRQKPAFWEKMQTALHQFKTEDKSPTSFFEERLHFPKSPHYLQWRYEQYPVSDYGLEVYEHNGMKYHLFLKIKSHNYYQELRICDVWVEGTKNWSSIASNAVRLARQLGCQVVSLLPEKGNTYEMLVNGFFSIQPLANIITIRDINCGAHFNEISMMHNWSFTMGDLELF